jgi:hypothetical protein
MNKKTKMALAFLILGVAGYYYWKSKQPTSKAFSGDVGPVEK